MDKRPGALVAELMDRFPWLLEIASLVLAWTVATLILSDMSVGPMLEHLPWSDFVVPALALGIVLVMNVLLHLQKRDFAVIKK